MGFYKVQAINTADQWGLGKLLWLGTRVRIRGTIVSIGRPLWRALRVNPLTLT